MGDFDNDILADLTGLAGIAQYDNNPTADPSAVAKAVEAPAPAATPADDYNSDINYEMSEDEIHGALRAQWKENYDQRFAAVSKTVAEIFHDDEPLLKWFGDRLGNHVNVVRIVDRIAAMLDGVRPQKTAAADTAALDAEIKEFQPGGRFHKDWVNGDHALNQRRLQLYSKRYKGNFPIS